jgi:hypothetical protein
MIKIKKNKKWRKITKWKTIKNEKIKRKFKQIKNQKLKNEKY